MSIKIYPYRQGSRSATELANAVGGRVLRLRGSAYRPRAGDVILNWGNGTVPSFAPATVLNRDVSVAANKLRTFERLRQDGQVSIPPYYTNRQDIPGQSYPIVCRTILNGSGGAGIHISPDPAGLVNAPLYVKYIKKEHEYRVHVFQGRIICIQRKARRNDVPREQANFQIRNLDNGFVFVLVADHTSAQFANVSREAQRAVQALGLDFGAVDIVWNRREGRAYVLEVNTAPGLEERTAQFYAEIFHE